MSTTETTLPVVLAFPGQGAQHPRMAAGLYGHDEVFTGAMDAAFDGLGPDGISARVVDVTRGVVRFQSGYVYHYAFVMLLGVAALITWYMTTGLVPAPDPPREPSAPSALPSVSGSVTPPIDGGPNEGRVDRTTTGTSSGVTTRQRWANGKPSGSRRTWSVATALCRPRP